MPSRCLQVEQGKTSWPELVGEIGKSSAITIENENLLVNTIIIQQGTIIPLIYMCNRVLVWVNDEGLTIRIPRIG
nr:proteinase inhibitor I13 [Tanacetum cinerariifolium]